MKNIYLIICLFIFQFAATAQNQSIDSLKNILKKTSQDTVRVNLLNNISTEFIASGHFDSANRYIKPSVDLLEKLHYRVGAVTAYHNLALYNFHIKEYKTGKFFLLKSLNTALLTHDKKYVAANYKELADLYQLQSNFKQAKESNAKYVLYRDSLAKEESVKHDNKNVAVNDTLGKEKVDLSAGDTDTKAVVVDDNEKQKILYISIGVLIILSVLIIWLMINRAKRKNIISEGNNVHEQNKIVEEPVQLKQPDIQKAAFLQKITEIEGLVASNKFEKKEAITGNIVPIKTEDKKESLDESVAKTEIGEDLALDESEEKIKKPTSGLANTNVINGTNEIETKQEAKQEPSKQNLLVVENTANDIEDAEKKDTPEIINRQYSNLIFPEQLAHFTAKFLGDTVKLFWKTDDEKNIRHFELEKSVDGAHYVSIEHIAAKELGSNNYETIDFKPLPGTNFYRLEMIDKEGDFIYSPIVQVEVLPVSTLTLICYPTHVKDVIMITAAGGKMPVMVNIFNKAGKKEFTIETPPTTTPIYLTSLAAGIYTLQMKCQGKTILQQLIKV